MRVALRDVARAAGVSLATASYALTGKGHLSSATRAHVRRVADELGYRGRMRLKRRIMLLHVEPDQMRRDLHVGLRTALRERDFELLAVRWPAAAQPEAGLPTEVRDGRVDGVIVFGGLVDAHFAERLSHASPTIFLGGTYLGLDVDSVWADASQAVYKAVTHLVDLGHRRIALVPGPHATFTTAEKLVGYRQAFAARAVPSQEDWICIPRAFSHDAGSDAARTLLSQVPRPTAVIAGHPALALGILQYARASGVRVPTDLSLISFEDDAAFAQASPSISAIDIGLPGIVAAAQAVLLDRIHDPHAAARRIRTSTSLLVRESSGPCLA